MRALIIVALSFVTSHNILSSFGTNKPFLGENERLREQNLYANIVFKNKQSNSLRSNEKQIQALKSKCSVNAVVSVVTGVVCAACAFIFADSKKFEAAFVYIALILTGVQWLLCASTRFAVFRFIPSLERKTSAMNSGIVKLIEKLVMVVLTIAYAGVLT